MKQAIPLLAVAILAAHAGSTAAQDLGQEELGALVKGRKWLIAMQGNLSHAGHATYWDFNADGSLCARFGGAKPGDRCADEGRWRLEGQNLCWDLKVIGEQYGYKSACVRVRKVGAQEYEAHNTKGGFRQFVFRPVK
jgi:hypothetical protein